MITEIEIKPEPYTIDTPRPRSTSLPTIIAFIALIVGGIAFYTTIGNPESQPQAPPAFRTCQTEGPVMAECLYEPIPICTTSDGGDQPFGCLLIDRRGRSIHWVVAMTKEFEDNCKREGYVRDSCMQLPLPHCSSPLCDEFPQGGLWLDSGTGVIRWVQPDAIAE